MSWQTPSIQVDAVRAQYQSQGRHGLVVGHDPRVPDVSNNIVDRGGLTPEQDLVFHVFQVHS